MLDLIDTKGKKDIKSMTLEEVTAEMTALGEKSFRAKQLYDWLHVKLAESFDDMSTLSKDLRQKLKENYSLTALQVAGERIAVSPREFCMYFFPGGLSYGLPLLCIYSGWHGAKFTSF